MTGRPSRNAAPPQAGVVAIALTGHSDEDLQHLIGRMQAAGITVWHSPNYAYGQDPVRRYVTADLRDPR